MEAAILVFVAVAALLLLPAKELPDDHRLLSLEYPRDRLELECRVGFWNGSRASHAELKDSDVDDSWSST